MDAASDDMAAVPQSDTAVLQCRTARRLARSFETVDITPGTACGTVSTGARPVVGDLEQEDTFSFHGARKLHQGVTVHQNISCSFDPCNCSCLACQKEHSIVSLFHPVVIGISDQNFVSAIGSGDETNCIAIVRMEDADLHDLTTMAFEIFEHVNVDSNFIFMLGSVSHLASVGTAAYTTEWTKCVQRFKGKWSNALLLPLFPMPQKDCNVGLAREITELATWFERVYRATPYGLTTAWAFAVRSLNDASVGLQPLSSPDVYTLSLPASLAFPAPSVPVRFVSKSSRPTGTKALSRKVSSELVRCLLTNLNSDLHTGLILEGDLLKDTGTPMVEIAKEPPNGLVVVCASHMKKCIPVFSLAKKPIFDFSRSGWMATPSNIQTVMDSIISADIPEKTPIVLDLLSNYVFRFADFDGSLLLPKKTQAGYHLPGDITLCDDRSVERLVSNVMPILDLIADHPKVFIPPQPRYIF